MNQGPMTMMKGYSAKTGYHLFCDKSAFCLIKSHRQANVVIKEGCVLDLRDYELSLYFSTEEIRTIKTTATERLK